MPTLGEKLRTLDNIEVEQRQTMVQAARQKHARFWEKWHPFRCTEQGDVEGHAGGCIAYQPRQARHHVGTNCLP